MRQRAAQAAGSARTTRRGLRPVSLLSESVPESLLSRLAPSHDPDGLVVRRPGRVDQFARDRHGNLRLVDFTLTGHLTGERLA